MTNYGLHQAMEAAGIEVATTKVGDRYVVEELLKRGWVLGGEQSGHVIDLRLTPSGDGIAAALLLLEALGDRDLSKVEVMHKLPQCLVNVPVSDRDGLDRAGAIWEAAKAESEALEGRGRVLVRPSGTEPLVRVMVEAPTKAESDSVADRLAQVVERELGPLRRLGPVPAAPSIGRPLIGRILSFPGRDSESRRSGFFRLGRRFQPPGVKALPDDVRNSRIRR